MNKLSQKLCAVVLTLAMVVGLLFGCSANSFLAKAITTNEETIEFGSYPQSLVRNPKTISELKTHNCIPNKKTAVVEIPSAVLVFGCFVPSKKGHIKGHIATENVRYFAVMMLF